MEKYEMFKFEDYENEKDPQFENVEKVKVEMLVGVPFVIEYTKFSEFDGEPMVTAKVSLKDGEQVFFYTGSKKIVNTLQRIAEKEGIIPRVPVTIGKYVTKNGMNAYKLKDIE